VLLTPIPPVGNARARRDLRLVDVQRRRALDDRLHRPPPCGRPNDRRPGASKTNESDSRARSTLRSAGQTPHARLKQAHRRQGKRSALPATPLFKTPEGARQRSENSLRQRRCLSSLRLGVGARRRHAYAASARRPGRVALLLVVRGRRFVDVARGDRICLLAAVPTALQVTLAGTTSRSLPCARVDSEVAPPGQYAWIVPAGPGGRGIKSCLAGSGRVHHRDLRPAVGELPCRSEESPRVCERHAVTHSDPVARIRDSGLTVSSCSQSAVGAASPLGCSCGDRADRTRPGIG
jgi:hypothetical protein